MALLDDILVGLGEEKKETLEVGDNPPKEEKKAEEEKKEEKAKGRGIIGSFYSDDFINTYKKK